jgi:sigma-E factor negative regulatory protein RseA
MKTRISALMDGELEDHEVPASFDALRRDETLRSQWQQGQLIGAALREEGHLDFDVTARVMAALDAEPVVLAPKPRAPRDWSRPAMALAATVAGVAVVAWLGLGATPEASSIAQLAQVPTGIAAAQAPAPSTPRLQEYLVAHQAYASVGPMAGGARNIRTVSVAEAR